MLSTDPKPAVAAFRKLNPDAASWVFVKTIAEATAWFRDRRMVGDKQPIPEEDLLTAGFPCEPYSQHPAGRFGAGGWQSHPLAHVLFDL